jgi:hypothetical protein
VEADCEHTDRTVLAHAKVHFPFHVSTVLNFWILNFFEFIPDGNTFYINTTILTFDMFIFH